VFFFFQAEDGIRDLIVTGVKTCALPIFVVLFIVRKDPALTEAAIKQYCHQHLTAYKQPRYVYFRDELPKTNVGKILRRALRDERSEERRVGKECRTRGAGDH